MTQQEGAGPSQGLQPRENYDSDIDTKLPMMPHSQPGPDERVAAGKSNKQADTKNNMGDPNMNPSPTGQLAWVGFGCGIFALAALSIAFCSPYWMQTWPNSFNHFRNIGLWEVCMDNYMHYKDDSQEIYSGCWWLFSNEKKYWKLREWILPRKSIILHLYTRYIGRFNFLSQQCLQSTCVQSLSRSQVFSPVQVC